MVCLGRNAADARLPTFAAWFRLVPFSYRVNGVLGF